MTATRFILGFEFGYTTAEVQVRVISDLGGGEKLVQLPVGFAPENLTLPGAELQPNGELRLKVCSDFLG